MATPVAQHCVSEHIVFFTCDPSTNMTCLVYVSDHCSRVVVSDHCRVIVSDHCRVIVNDHCRVIVSDHCRAVVDGIKSLT